MISGKRKLYNRPGTATQQKGVARLGSILDAARLVFCEQGYASLTMRKVAQKAGMSVGNLNYYYHSKEDLLRDLTEYMADAYLERFGSIAKQAGSSAEKRLEAILRFWIQDLGSAETTVFFPELWAMANHHAFVATLTDKMYRKACQPLNDLIAELNPSLTKRENAQLALYMCAAMEGLTIFVGYQKPWGRQMDALKNLSIKNFISLAKNTQGTNKSTNTRANKDAKAHSPAKEQSDL